MHRLYWGVLFEASHVFCYNLFNPFFLISLQNKSSVELAPNMYNQDNRKSYGARKCRVASVPVAKILISIICLSLTRAVGSDELKMSKRYLGSSKIIWTHVITFETGARCHTSQTTGVGIYFLERSSIGKIKQDVIKVKTSETAKCGLFKGRDAGIGTLSCAEEEIQPPIFWAK